MRRENNIGAVGHTLVLRGMSSGVEVREVETASGLSYDSSWA